MIDFSLQKTKKWWGLAKYKENIGLIYLLKFENFEGFSSHFVYVYFHEICHLLLRKLGVKGFSNEEKISKLAEWFEVLDNFMKDFI